MTPETEDNLIRARLSLFRNFPFFGELAKYLRPIASEDVLTAAIDAKGRFFLNPEFAGRARTQDLVFILAHEVMHLVHASHKRAPKNVNAHRWQVAADIAINSVLVNADVPLPSPKLIVPLYRGYEKYHGKTHEEIYATLPEAPKLGGCWIDESCACEALFEDGDSLEALKWTTRIGAAMGAARAAGKLPGTLEVFLAELTEPKKNWKRLLSLTLQTECKRTYLWRRPNRRTLGLGIVTPSIQTEIQNVVIYLDTSGSMYDELVNESLSEIVGIVRAAGKTTLLLGDTKVYFCGPVHEAELQRLQLQRGGTDFRVVFTHIEDEKLFPRAFVGFSDLCGPFPENPPPYPVIWCRSHTSTSEAPWGTMISM